MKKRINLLSRKKRYSAFAVYAVRIRRTGTILGIVLFFLFIFVIVKMVDLKKQMNELTRKKEQYLSFLVDEKDTEAGIRYFKGKETQLNKYLEEDAQFTPYYQVLIDAISTESAVLDSISIDKNRDSTFIVKFQNYEGMITFLKYVESDTFLGFFDDLSMASLNLIRNTTAQKKAPQTIKTYQLQFKGKFKKITNE